MKIITSILILFLGFSSCDASKNDTSKYEAQNPLEDLVWLKELKESLKDSDLEKSIYQASYKKETVFYLMITDPRVRLAFGLTLWNSEGKVIREFKSGEYEEFDTQVLNKIEIYKHIPRKDE